MAIHQSPLFQSREINLMFFIQKRNPPKRNISRNLTSHCMLLNKHRTFQLKFRKYTYHTLKK